MNLLAASALVLAIHAPAVAKRPYLNIGDAAPALKPERWLKGTPVSEFRRGEVYVVEFWATWCGPCKQNIPHLTDLAKRYQGKAHILGISIWESNDPTSTSYMKRVEDFVKSEGDKMDYIVAADGPKATVANAWMKAADEGGIPTSFIVGKDGKIAWIGHPAQLESTLSQVVEDKFDVASARSKRAADVETVRPIRQALEQKSYRAAIDLIHEADAKHPEQSRMWDYDLLVAMFHAEPPAAMKRADAILADAQGDIGAYRMVVSIFASQKDLSRPTYVYGRGLSTKALAKNEMKYLFLAMDAEICSSLGDTDGAVKSQEQAVEQAEHDTHAPKDFVEFLKKNLATMRQKAAKH